MLSKNWLYKNNIQTLKTPAKICGSFFYAFIFSILSIYSMAQINLVQNPSFEIYSSCPNNTTQIKKAIGWDTLKAGGGFGADYYNACGTPNAYSVPNNIEIYQNARTGGAYVNVVSFYTAFGDQREYFQTKLLKKLQNNTNYCVTMYVNLTNRSTCAIDQLGAYFDDGSVNAPPGSMVVNGTINPQVSNPSGNFITDTLNWTKIQGIFVANGTEEYLSLGNFKPATLTNTISVSSDIYKHASYFFDDISVIEINSKANAGTDALICNGDSAFIGTNEEALDCHWFSNNIQIAQSAGIWVKPTTNQQYIIKQDVCGNISYDTVQVTIKDVDCNPVINSEIPNTFTPNGDGINDVWHFNLGTDVILNGLEVYNRWGNLIKKLEIDNSNYILWDGRTTSGEPCSDGIYFYVLKYTDVKGEIQNKKGYISLFK